MDDTPYALIAVNKPIRAEFTYEIPETLRATLRPGCRVRVRFGKNFGLQTGVCVARTAEKPGRFILKKINDQLDREPIFDESMLKLTRWMADYYFCSWGEALFAAMPAGVKHALRDEDKMRECVALNFPVEQLQTVLSGIDERHAVRAAALRMVARFDGELTVGEVAESIGASPSPVKWLLKEKQLCIQLKLPKRIEMQDALVERKPALALNAEQQQALQAILKRVNGGGFESFLLHGVTGSGKTEVYLQAIDHSVGRGCRAIVLVPEISLTPQTARRFRERLDRVAVLHSALTDKERYEIWMRCLRDEVDVVIGPRSALFAPVKKLGLIVIDEEHDGSFKQQNSPRYHARDTAVMRAKIENIPVILGSATPSLESYHNAQTGKYTLLSLPHRVLERPLPSVVICDMGEEMREQKRFVVLSRVLDRELERELGAGRQAILFLNRKGYFTSLQCAQCGFVWKCPRCEMPFVYHKKMDEGVCHYCNKRLAAPKDCPDCHHAQFKTLGLGIERVEEKLQHHLARYKISRMDADTLRSGESYERVLGEFARGESQILLGTQIVAKGHDFPGVTLVGVISADTSLNLPDFRSAERTFQLLSQVAGRAGRGEHGGKVILQTFRPQHYAIRHARTQDYVAFAREELELRKTASYPPFTHLARIVITGERDDRLINAIDTLAKRLEQPVKRYSMRLLGPAPCPIPRIRNKDRWHLLLFSQSVKHLHYVLNDAAEQLLSGGPVGYEVDVDPLDMM